jgi:hypothetical protein
MYHGLLGLLNNRYLETPGDHNLDRTVVTYPSDGLHMQVPHMKIWILSC